MLTCLVWVTPLVEVLCSDHSGAGGLQIQLGTLPLKTVWLVDWNFELDSGELNSEFQCLLALGGWAQLHLELPEE